MAIARISVMESAPFLEDNHIYHGDCRDLLTKVQPESVSLSFWSPPYFVGKPYEKDLTFDQWQDLLRSTIALHFDVLKPGGFLVINIADILAFSDPDMPRIQAETLSRRLKITKQDVLEAQRKYSNYNRYQLAQVLGVSEQTIDRRLNGNNIRGGKHAAQTRVKLVGGLVEEWGLEAGFYLYDRRIWVKDPCWENSKWHSLSYRSVDETEYLYIFWKPGVTVIDRNRLTKEEWSSWGSRGVWEIPSVRNNNDHPAKFPIELATRVIRLFSAPGDLVLDPFVGSGTTALAAIKESRRYLGFDMVEEYVTLARQNCRRAMSLVDAENVGPERSWDKP